MQYTVDEVYEMSVNEIKEKLAHVLIADRDSTNYEEAYIFHDESDELGLGVVFVFNDYDITISMVAGYEFDIRDFEEMNIA